MINGLDAKFQFEYSSFYKIFIDQKSLGDKKLTLTIGIAYPPEVMLGNNKQKFVRVFEWPKNDDNFWKHLIKASAFQVELNFDVSF